MEDKRYYQTYRFATNGHWRSSRMSDWIEDLREALSSRKGWRFAILEVPEWKRK